MNAVRTRNLPFFPDSKPGVAGGQPPSCSPLGKWDLWEESRKRGMVVGTPGWGGESFNSAYSMPVMDTKPLKLTAAYGKC